MKSQRLENKFFIWLLLWMPLFLLLPGYCLSQPGRTQALIVDHSAAGLFDSIPDSLLYSAIAKKLMFRHASVGTTINDGLNCIQGTRSNPVECTLFPDYKYDRRTWYFQPRGNNGWYGKINDFVAEVHKQADSLDVFCFKFCYIDGLDETAEPCGKPFSVSKTMNAWDSLRIKMEDIENSYPEKTFIWWTIPLTQSGQYCTDTLNDLIRQYARDNHKILFDIADIEAYDSNGNLQTNDQGWEIAWKYYCGEQNPGAQACHPNWTGKLLLGKAFWWMMVMLDSEEPPLATNVMHEKFVCSIFPNPVHVKLSIKMQQTEPGDTRFCLYDLHGRQVQLPEYHRVTQGSATFFHWHLSGVSPGIYILKIRNASGIKTEKIVKF